MKQRQYTELQLAIIKVLGRIERNLSKFENRAAFEEIEEIKKDFGIEPPHLTLRQYIETKCSGSYHTFWFTINEQKIGVTDLGGFLNDKWCHLFTETNNYYVVKDETKDNGGDATSYHCDHYLTLEPKED